MNVKRTMSLAVALILVLLLGVNACASQAQTYVDIENYYINIVTFTERGNYEKAVALYNEQPEKLAEYKDAYAYCLYAQGMLNLDKNEFEDAFDAFSALYEVYGERFPDRGTMAKCGQLMLYTQGRLLEEAGKYAEALECYKQTEGCRDTLKRRLDLQGRLDPEPTPARYAYEITECTPNSIALNWKDAQGAEGYTVSYMPAGGGAIGETTVSQTSAALNDLLPETSYQIMVKAQGDADALIVTAATSGAPSLRGAISRESRMGLLCCTSANENRYNISDLFARQLITPADREESGAYRIEVNRSYAKGFLSYYLQIELSNMDASKDEFEWLVLLRLDGEGAYVCAGGTAAPAAGTILPASYVIPVGDALEKCFAFHDGQWPTVPGRIELYIDGMYVDEVSAVLQLS